MRTQMQQAWEEGILKARWGWRNCVRIWLRKQRGADYKIRKRDMRHGMANLAHICASLTEEDIMGAYENGEKMIANRRAVALLPSARVDWEGTHRMACVAYEAEFVDVFVRNVPGWVVFDKEVKSKRRESKAKGKGKGKGKGKQTRKAKGTWSKRKPIEIDSESSLEEEGDSDSDIVKMEVRAGSDYSYQGMSGDLPRSSTGLTRPAATTVKRKRTT